MTAPTDGLVERLRFYAEDFPHVGCLHEAANRIEHLEARIEAAEKVLEPLLKGWAAFTDDGTGWGNHEEAYQCLAKGMDEHWSAAAQWQAGREGVG